MFLRNEIDKMRKEIRTDAYAMSVGEWISMWESGELDIHPAFQRFFRWSNAQKSSLIESIFLGIPLPPIFVSQRKDGIWDVVDGLQRLSTIFHLVGNLKDERGDKVEPLILSGTKYLPLLEGKKWIDDDETKSFTQEERLLIKRSKIGVNIILQESDEKAKYELFQRLNTGGSHLTGQEIRNCILVMLNRSRFDWLKKLSEDNNFRDCISLSTRALNEQYDMELVLRFLILVEFDSNEVSKYPDMGSYLTEKMMKIAEDRDFDIDGYRKLFEKTFELLYAKCKQNAFRKFDKSKSTFTGGFSVSAFEAVATGIAGAIKNDSEVVADVETKIKEMWETQEFTDNSGTGFNAKRRVPHLVPFGIHFFKI